MATDEQMMLTDLESKAIRDTFEDDNTRTDTKGEEAADAGDGGTSTTTKTPQSPVENKNDVELQPLNIEQTNNFAVYTSDVSFWTKVRLLLWKNFKIQMLRRPLACGCKIGMPVIIMLIMVAFTLIPGLLTFLDTYLSYDLCYKYVYIIYIVHKY